MILPCGGNQRLLYFIHIHAGVRLLIVGRQHDLRRAVGGDLYALRLSVVEGCRSPDLADGRCAAAVIEGAKTDRGEAGRLAQLAHFAFFRCSFQSIYGCAADVKPLKVAGGTFYSYGFLTFTRFDGRSVLQIINLELLPAVVCKSHRQLCAVGADSGIAVGCVPAAGAGDGNAVCIFPVAAQCLSRLEAEAGDGSRIAATLRVAADPQPGDAPCLHTVQVGAVAELL